MGLYEDGTWAFILGHASERWPMNLQVTQESVIGRAIATSSGQMQITAGTIALERLRSGSAGQPFFQLGPASTPEDVLHGDAATMLSLSVV